MKLGTNRSNLLGFNLKKIRRKKQKDVIEQVKNDEAIANSMAKYHQDKLESSRIAKNQRRRQTYCVKKWLEGKTKAEIDAKVLEIIAGVDSPANQKLARERNVQILATPDLESVFTFMRTKGKKIKPQKMATGSDNERYQYGDYILRDAYDMTGLMSTLFKGKDELIFIP
jgi:hypothetical protein